MMERKTPESSGDSEAPCDGFNGAAPMMERKTYAECRDQPRFAGFNGAAPMMERKTNLAGTAVGTTPLLQWGRSDDGAENVGRSDRE